MIKGRAGHFMVIQVPLFMLMCCEHARLPGYMNITTAEFVELWGRGNH